MTLNPPTLARVQFAFTVSFHIIVPTMSIGLAMFLAVVEGLWLKTGMDMWIEMNIGVQLEAFQPEIEARSTYYLCSRSAESETPSPWNDDSVEIGGVYGRT
jgi:hypothetical protein